MLTGLLNLVPSLIKTFAGFIGGEKGARVAEAADTIAEVADQFSTGAMPPEQRAQLESALMEHKVKMEELALRDAEGARDVIKTAMQSEDVFVRRARPAFLWTMYIVFIVNFIIFPIVKLPVIELPNIIYNLFGTAFIGYSVLRTVDKGGSSGIGKIVKGIIGAK